MSSLRLLASWATATGNAVVEETRARAVRRAVKSCIVEVAHAKERRNKVKYGVVKREMRMRMRMKRSGMGWDGMESSVESEIEVLFMGEGKRSEVFTTFSGRSTVIES
jgi:hypothetical protein